MPTLYLTEDYSFVRRENQECLLVQIPERKGKNGTAPSPARKERVPLLKVDEVVVVGEVTLTASAIHVLLEREGCKEFIYRNPFPMESRSALIDLARWRARTLTTKEIRVLRLATERPLRTRGRSMPSA